MARWAATVESVLIDPDHMSVEARSAALDQIDDLGYHGVSSSHSWATPDAYPRIYRLGGEHDPSDRKAAFAMALEWGDRIPLGVIYRHDRPTFEERSPVLSGLPLVKQEQFNRGKLARTLADFR